MQGGYYSIAIDGPASSGKSTIAKKVSKELGFEYVDTGAMYRALTWKVLEYNIDPKNKEKVIDLLNDSEIDFIDGDIYLDGNIVNDEIRLNHVSQNVSYIAIIPEVREKMVESQRAMANKKNIIMDGRDIGTVVLVESNFKFFLTASVEERARRRYSELSKGDNTGVNLKDIESEIKKRDKIDTNREINPLKMADDAILIDTTEKTIQEVVNIIISYVKGR